MEKVDALGVSGMGSVVPSQEEHAALTGAVRESVRVSTLRLVRHLDPKDEAQPCPSCGDRVIHMDAPESFVYDRRWRARICKACGAERDLVHMVRPDADIGGEG